VLGIMLEGSLCFGLGSAEVVICVGGWWVVAVSRDRSVTTL
jgi:uncharacterized membrane protein YedE/YeeE